MPLQIVDGEEVYVVEFKTMPELPIKWSKPEEMPYALALHAALENGIITEPGKYAIRVTTDETGAQYNIGRVLEG